MRGPLDLRALAAAEEACLLADRRALHRWPELSSVEFRSSAYLQEACRALGMTIRMVDETGFIARLDSGRPGPAIALRADLDALPVPQAPENLAGPRLVRSEREGISHACGHDAHMALALATARVVRAAGEAFCGSLELLFESAEETGAGIEAMLAALREAPPDAILGTHVLASLDSGRLCVDAGPRMAGQNVLRLTVVGRGGHGARPDLAVNPIFAAAAMLQGLASAWVNQIDVTRTVTLGIAEIHAGEAINVIPDELSFGGTLRFFDEEAGAAALEVALSVCRHIAQAHRCELRVDPRTGPLTRPVVNDARLSAVAQRAIAAQLPGALAHDVSWFASESFSLYGAIAPSLFMFAGIRNPEVGSGAEHHNRHFDIDEASLLPALTALASIVLALMAEDD